MTNNWQPHIPDFRRGERLSAARLNELADAIASILWKKQQAAGAAFGVKSPPEIIGKLTTDLAAADDFATDPATAEMKVWIKHAVTGELVESTRTETVKQRFTGVTSLDAGAEVKARWIEGEWLVDAPALKVHHIWFTVDTATCNPDDSVTLTVTVTRYSGGCTAAIPGADSYDSVTVEDPCSILSHYTIEFLEAGAVGRATYMYPRSGYCEPEWILDTICGAPECE